MNRLHALEHIRKKPLHSQYAFSGYFSADPKTRDEVQAEFLNFLKRMEKKVAYAPAEAVYQVGFDLLNWEEI